MALNSSTIKSIQDIMRKDAGVDGDAQRLGQLTWLFFLKIFDDREPEWEITVKKYRSPVPEELRWRNWAADTEGLTGDGLLEFINNRLFPSLKGLSPEASPRHRVIHDVFEDAYQYMKNGTLLRQVINKITESLDFNRMEDRHVFGDLLQIELALECLVQDVDPAHIAYHAARRHAEKYDSRYGTGLIPASANALEQIVSF